MHFGIIKLKRPKRSRVADLSTIFFDDGRSSVTFKSPSDPYLVVNHLPPAANTETDDVHVPSGPTCALDPPLHWHYDQAEIFHVVEGRARFYLDAITQTVSAGDVVVVPKQAFHTFRNASTEERLVIEFALDPQFSERDEAFFRNAQTYRDDCRKAGISRSWFQVLMFNRMGNVVLALPGPRFIVKPMGLFLNLAGSLIGRWILGYSYSYPEYYHAKTH